MKETIPIERVKMKIKISMTMSDAKKCKDQIKALFLSIISEDHDGQFELVRNSRENSVLYFKLWFQRLKFERFMFQKKATVGFEPTPRRTSALNWRLRPLGHVTMLTN